MDLPEDEQRQLKQIEEQLAEEDPAFVARLNRKPLPHHRLSQRALFVVLLLLTYVAGLTLLVGGVALGSVALIVLGVAVTAVYPVLVTVRGVRGKR
ncbi:DUF3040 domain-containing protein [Lentzea sp. CC55]|uniref:DUF3040 domain-containing protein n=1 Tax=Lentzea sp. CC55 TaxID=2884909 RepID=UPI0027E0F81E|nr:DUF3040 domain-containing protein [Lentzea sp. CC55]MCG8922845.1 DUF3040 domain-containing protein [Lentzea sp. CC55]